ncbi:hypothetical protein HDU96_004405 [Phlyctochytrium bullatum]|nr:hypothetical protein HDU96_004405 [Phlyctochytrium bullatum]
MPRCPSDCTCPRCLPSSNLSQQPRRKGYFTKMLEDVDKVIAASRAGLPNAWTINDPPRPAPLPIVPPVIVTAPPPPPRKPGAMQRELRKAGAEAEASIHRLRAKRDAQAEMVVAKNGLRVRSKVARRAGKAAAPY